MQSKPLTDEQLVDAVAVGVVRALRSGLKEFEQERIAALQRRVERLENIIMEPLERHESRNPLDSGRITFIDRPGVEL